MSTNTGVAPTRAMAPTVAKNVYGVVMTSSPSPMFSAIKQANKASVPEETPTPYEQPLYCAIAFSHSSTFGPRTKCWDSITSAIAASTSALIVAYCALRSSSGTCITGFLFQLLVGFGAFVQVLWYRGFLVKVEATQNAWLNLLITVAALRAYHHSIGVWRLKSVTVTAHPTRLPRWITDHQREVRNFFGNHRTGPNKRISADLNSTDDCRICSDCAAAFQQSSFVQRMPVYLRPGISNVRKNTRRAKKNIVLDDRTCIDGHIVLNLDVIPDNCPTIDVHVLPNNTPLADSSPLHHMRKMPNLCAGPNLSAFIGICGFMHEIRKHLLFLFHAGRSESNFPIPQCPLTGIQNSQYSEPFISVAYRRSPGSDAVEEVLALRPQRLLLLQIDDFAVRLHCRRNSILPFHLVRIQNQFVLGRVIEDRHFL